MLFSAACRTTSSRSSMALGPVAMIAATASIAASTESNEAIASPRALGRGCSFRAAETITASVPSLPQTQAGQIHGMWINSRHRVVSGLDQAHIRHFAGQALEKRWRVSGGIFAHDRAHLRCQFGRVGIGLMRAQPKALAAGEEHFNTSKILAGSAIANGSCPGGGVANASGDGRLRLSLRGQAHEEQSGRAFESVADWVHQWKSPAQPRTALPPGLRRSLFAAGKDRSPRHDWCIARARLVPLPPRGKD